MLPLSKRWGVANRLERRPDNVIIVPYEFFVFRFPVTYAARTEINNFHGNGNFVFPVFRRALGNQRSEVSRHGRPGDHSSFNTRPPLRPSEQRSLRFSFPRNFDSNRRQFLKTKTSARQLLRRYSEISFRISLADNNPPSPLDGREFDRPRIRSFIRGRARAHKTAATYTTELVTTNLRKNRKNRMETAAVTIVTTDRARPEFYLFRRLGVSRERRDVRGVE